MKHYNQPETNILQVMNNSIICASGPAAAPAQVTINPISKINGGEW